LTIMVGVAIPPVQGFVARLLMGEKGNDPFDQALHRDSRA
jgi:hypothetical protein